MTGPVPTGPVAHLTATDEPRFERDSTAEIPGVRVPNVEFTVASDRDSWIVVGPLSSGSTRVVARCDEQRDAETLSLLLNIPFDDLIAVVRAVVDLAADDDLSLVQIRARVAGMGASAASWLARVGSITASAGDGSDPADPSDPSSVPAPS